VCRAAKEKKKNKKKTITEIAQSGRHGSSKINATRLIQDCMEHEHPSLTSRRLAARNIVALPIPHRQYGLQGQQTHRGREETMPKDAEGLRLWNQMANPWKYQQCAQRIKFKKTTFCLHQTEAKRIFPPHQQTIFL